MAYLYDIAVTGSTAGGTGVAQNMPDHQSGDLLVMMVAVDTGTAAISASSGAWSTTGFGTGTVTQGIITYAWWRQATSSAETVNITTADATSGIILCFREVDATTPFDGVAVSYAGVSTATTTPVSATLGTTNTADALIVSLIAQEGTNPMVVSSPGAMSAFMADSGGTTATLSAQTSAAWYIQRAVGVPPVINWTSNVSGAYVRLTFALKPASGSRVPPYIDDSASPASLIHNGSYSGSVNGVTHTTNGITATINGKTATPTTAALLADSGFSPYLSVLSSAAAQTAVTALVGPEITMGTAFNATGKLVAGATMAGNWKQAMFGVGSVKQGGVVMRLGSGGTATTAWNAYQVSAKDAQVPPATPAVFVIEPGYATTAYASGSSNCDGTAVKYVQCLRNAPLFSSQVGLTECYLIDKQIVAGGDATYPVDLNGLVAVGKSFRLPLIQKAGGASVVLFAPVQIGGGDAVNFQVDSGVIQFPRRASTTTRDLQYHASDNKLGLYMAGKSGDVVKLTNSLVTSSVPQVFEITSSATNAATWDFTGTTFIGMTVTLRNVVTFDSLTFSGCPSLTFSGCTVQNSTITNIPTTNASITTDASTNIDGCTINTSNLPASGYWWSGSDPSIFSNCDFIGDGSGHALRITATSGTVTLDGNTWTGFGASTSTGAALYFSATTGSITLEITNGSTPSYTSAGIAVTVSNPKTLTFKGFEAGSDIVVTQSDTNTELLNVDAAAGPTYAWNHNYAGTTVDIRVMKEGKMPWSQYDFTLPSANQDFTVAQVTDRAFQ